MFCSIKKILFFVSIVTTLSTRQIWCSETGTVQPGSNQIIVTVPAVSINLPKSFDEFGNAVEHLVKENKTTATILGAFAIAPLIYTAYKVNRGIAHYANSGAQWIACKFFKKNTATKIGNFAEYITFLCLAELECHLLITNGQKLASDTRRVMEAAQKLTSSHLSINTQQPTVQIASA